MWTIWSNGIFGLLLMSCVKAVNIKSTTVFMYLIQEWFDKPAAERLFSAFDCLHVRLESLTKFHYAIWFEAGSNQIRNGIWLLMITERQVYEASIWHARHDIITHRRSVAERGGCFQRCLCLCQFVCRCVCPHNDFRTTKLRTTKVVG